MPAFFECSAWKKLNHTVLSTSNCGNPSLRLFGFGPVVRDGFGVGYIIKDNALSFSIASKHRQTKRFMGTLEKVLCELGEILVEGDTIQVSGDRRAGSITQEAPSTSPKLVAEPDAYSDIWGESATVPETKPRFTRTFSFVRRGQSLSADRLSQTGDNL